MRADLAVHHPARRDDVSAGTGLGHRGLGVDLERRVVVDVAALVEHAAVAVVGVLVDAEVGDQRRRRRRRRRAGRRGASCTMPSGSKAPLPDGVLVRRHAEQDDGAARRARPARSTSLRRLSRCAGRRRAATRSAAARSMPSRTNSGATRSAGAHGRLGDEVAHRRRAAQPPRPVVGNIGAIVRAGSPTTDRTTRTDRPVMSPPVDRERGGDGGDDVVAGRVMATRPRSRARRRRRPRCSARSRRAGRPMPIGASSRGCRPARQHDDVGRRSAATSAAGRRASHAVGLHGFDVVAERRASPSASDDDGPIGLGDEHRRRARRELGEQALDPLDAGTRSTGRPASSARAAAVAAPTAASRTARRCGRRGPTARAPLADVTTSQSNARQRGQRARAARRRRRPASPISISGTWSTIGAVVARADRPSSPLRCWVMTIRRPASARPVTQPTAPRARRASAAAAALVVARRRARASMRSRNTVPSSPARNACERCRRRRARRPAASSPTPSSARKARSTSTAWRVGGVVDRARAAAAVVVVVGAALDGDAALADGRHEPARVEALGDPLGQPEHLSAATAITIAPPSGTFAEAGVDVAAQLDERGGRAAPRRAAPAGAPTGRDRRARRELVERARRSARRRRRAARRTRRSPARRRSSTAGPWPSARRRRRGRRARPAGPP